jgi:thiol-disulfide isomerase/thioredoxin
LPDSRGAQPGLAALRSAIPGGSGGAARTAPTTARFERTSPWLIPAMGGAIPLILVLVGGQILFPSKTFGLGQVALDESIQMGGAKSAGKDDASSGGSERVALRVPSEGENAVKPSLPPDSTADSKSDGKAKSSSDAATSGSDEPKKKRLVKFLGGKLTLDVYEHPVIGSPEAPHIVVEMISYDCPHCRKMFPIMEHALERYGDQVALLIMVQPLDKECNKLVTDPAMSHPGSCAVAKLAMGIARVNPGAFASFHEFLMSTKDKPPDFQAALPKAYVLADRDRLRKLTQSDELDKQLESYVDLFATLQKRSGKQNFGLPVQIIGDQVMNGSVEHEEDVFKAWEQNLGIKPK